MYKHITLVMVRFHDGWGKVYGMMCVGKQGLRKKYAVRAQKRVKILCKGYTTEQLVG